MGDKLFESSGSMQSSRTNPTCIPSLPAFCSDPHWPWPKVTSHCQQTGKNEGSIFFKNYRVSGLFCLFHKRQCGLSWVQGQRENQERRSSYLFRGHPSQSRSRREPRPKPGLEVAQEEPKAMVITVGKIRRSCNTCPAQSPMSAQCQAAWSAGWREVAMLTHHVHPATGEHPRFPVISQNPPFIKSYEVIYSNFTLNHFQLGIHPQLIQISEVFDVLT